ncbi:DUF1631 domain-containing protein [Hahella sp. NBU794]|uniref:DUF1631 domain-containing protein n=1 Tax=Hahella sp. NBU794 TaxID=3422590 RepID=UPI003D6F49CC
MNKGSGVSYIRERVKAHPKPADEQLLTRIRDHSISMLLNFLNSMFDGVDDSFFELANHAHTNNEQNRYFEAMREIRIKRKGIENHFQQELARLFNQPPSQHKSSETLSDNVDVDVLSLVQNDALEESVAINSMISKARANFSGSLLQFQTRVSSVYGETNEENAVNPLDPEHICKAFSDACIGLDIEIKEKLIVYKQFDRYVMGNLVESLEEANKIMIQAGVMPNLKYTAKKSRVTPRSTSDVSARPLEAQSDANSHDGAGDVFSQVQELLSALRNTPSDSSEQQQGANVGAGAGGRQAPPPGNVQFIADADLLSILSRLQHSVRTENLAEGPVVALDLRSAVQGLLTEESQKSGKATALDQVDEDLINLVSMLFEFILDDYNLSAPIQVLISRLQIPILKVAIRDKSFFSKPSHPARKLLNALAKAGIGWSDASEKKRDKLYEQIHRAVQRILEEFNGESELFEEIYQEFSQYLSREERKAKLVEQRTKEAEIGRVKSHKAHQVVEQILSEKIAAQPLPPVAVELLRGGWSRVMFLAYLKEDTEHRLNQCTKVVDELTWCLQPHAEVEARQRWVKVVPQLLKNLKAGLKEVSYNSAKLEHMLGELKKALTETFKQQSITSAQNDAPKPPVSVPVVIEQKLTPAAKTAVERQSEYEDAALAEYLAKVDEMECGAWIEFSLVNGARFRCKLSTKIEDSDTYIFVNRLGLKVVEKTRGELAHELRKGRIKALEEGLLFDRAMDAVIGNLRKMSGKAA